jgi:hypothetical protein
MVATMAVLAALNSRRKNTTPTIQPNICPTAGEKVAAANCSPIKRNMSSLRCHRTEAISSRLVRCMVWRSTEGRESIAQPSSAVANTTSIATGVIALSDSRATLGCSMVDPGSSFMTPVRLAIDSAPDNARITPTNCTHTVPRLACRGSRKRVVRCGALSTMSAMTMSAVGNDSATARLPECFGPK